MKKRIADNKGGAEFSLLVSIAITGIADLLLLAAICSGWLDKGRAPDRGTYAQAMAERAAEEALKPVSDTSLTPAGSGWSSSQGDYYFTEEGDGCYFISDRTENYVKGSAVIRQLSADELYDTEGAEVLMSSKNAQYFRIDVYVLQELYYGSRRGGYNYTIYMGIDGNDAYIYDSGWGEVVSAGRKDLPLTASLEDHFTEEGTMYANVWGPGGDPSVFFREDVDFNTQGSLREVWNAVDIGDKTVFKRESDGALCITGISSQEEPTLLYKPEDGRQVTVFGTDGEDLLICLGRSGASGYETDELIRMDIKTGSTVSLVHDRVQDFCVYNDIIYYTDYERLMRLDKSGNTKLLWDYGVYSYEVAAGMVFLYNGNTWELLDADTGEDYGYIKDGMGYTYECDMTVHTEDYLYFVAYDYARESITLRALNKWTGDERPVGEEYGGKKSDTYNVLFTDTYCYYTVSNGEKLVRVDVSTGDVLTRELSDAGWWYATEILKLQDGCVLHAYDALGYEKYLSVGPELQMTEIPALSTYPETTAPAE